MNSLELCRLCLSTTDLIDVFDPKLSNADHLRQCVLLSTGIYMHKDDWSSKYICCKCSYLILLQYEFRQRALENNKSLQLYQEKQYELKQKKLGQNAVAKTKHRPNVTLPRWVDLHWSVKALAKRFKRIKVPVSVLTKNISPMLVLTKVIHRYSENSKDSENFSRNLKGVDDNLNRVEPVKKVGRQLSNKRKMQHSEQLSKCEHCYVCFSKQSKLNKHNKLHKQCQSCKKWLWATNYKRHLIKCPKIVDAPKVPLIKIDEEYPLLKPFLNFNMTDKISLKKRRFTLDPTVNSPINGILPRSKEIEVMEVISNDADDAMLENFVTVNGICLSMCSVSNLPAYKYALLNATVREELIENKLEHQKIAELFEKYSNLSNIVVTPDNAKITSLSDGCINVSNAGLDLKRFFIPVNFRINSDKNMRVKINTNRKFKKETAASCDWSAYEVIELVKKEVPEEEISIFYDLV